MTRIFDSHAHLTDEKFSKNLDDILARATANNVIKILAVADSIESSKKILKLTNIYPDIYPTAGIHPHYSESTDEIVFEELEKFFLDNQSIKAVGEIGLDFYYGKDTKKSQYVLLEKQLVLARKLNLPVILHCRDAEQELFDMLKKFNGIEGVIHCFSSTRNWCEKFVDLGLYVSFSGIVTFKNADDIRSAAEWIPLNKMLVETDCPYLAPQGYRGKTNEPSYIVNTVGTIAQLRNLSSDYIAEQTYENTVTLFKIEDN